ncbi:uncharacterized protein LOC132299684 [Cornus florida]|uniref:uncharacterized protein LOC132299684 n=1 Tax=Cornus florida TaxID=4283 RepID=UPI0028996AAA|nr:uncharacterized protein LOC132299684 [Cornus florida]
MAQTPFSLLLRRLYTKNPNLHWASQPLFLSHRLAPKNFPSLSFLQSNSTSTSNNTTTTSSDPNKPTSLSARLSFVFDQIDAIEKERSEKDETLQRIRAWRESKKNKNNEDTKNLGSDSPELGSSELKSTGLDSGELEAKKNEERGGLMKKAVELVHPWPEWIELMERLVHQNYFDHRRKDEDKMIEDLGFDMSQVAEEGIDFMRDWKTVQTACINFGKDRFDILRSLSRQDIQILVGHGCPSADKKVVFSAKLLRKHVHLDEGDVCSSCSLRNSCERAYLITNKEDEARTIDVMRVILTYGFDPVNGSVVNESLLKIKSVKTVIRKLLHEIVKLSAVPIDPNLPPPVINKPPPKVKQPPPPPKKRVGRDDIEMKKGDWLCPKCDFMNFAKNTVCLQCDGQRPKRQLLPGEWECPKCNFLNYRRNMACFHCEHKRPPDEFTENQMQERQRGPRTSMEKVPSRAEVSNAWNFDFDDNESDGADVATFEYADSRNMNDDFPLDSRVHGENIRGAEDFHNASKNPRVCEREYSDPGQKKPGMGFDDFDDEEDDVDSYELDTQNSNQVKKNSSIDFSEVEGYSDSEDIEVYGGNRLAPQRTRSLSHNKPLKPIHKKTPISGSEDDELDFDSDEDLPVHPNWKSSHVADSRQGNRRKGGRSFGSDEELELSSGSEDFANKDFGPRQNKGNRRGSSRGDFRRGGRSDTYDDDDESGLESGDDDRRSFRGSRRGNKAGAGNTSRGRGRSDFSGPSRSRSNDMMGDRRKPFNDNFNRSSRGSHGNNRSSRGPQRDDYGRHRVNDREAGFQNSRGTRRGGFGNRQREVSDREAGFQNFGGTRRGGFGNRQREGSNNSYNPYDDERYKRPRINVR